MTEYNIDPAGVNLRRLKALAERHGGTARLHTPTRADGTPGVPSILVAVPDDTPRATALGLAAQATGARDADLTTGERLADYTPAPSVFAALLVLASTTATPAERFAAQAVVNAAAEGPRKALDAGATPSPVTPTPGRND